MKNTGDRRGAEVVQCYVEPIAPRLFRPTHELKAFAKVVLDPGEQTVVQLTLDDRAFAYWDPTDTDWNAMAAQRAAAPVRGRIEASRRDTPGWCVDAGDYRVHLGRSSVDLTHALDVTIDD